MTSRARLDRQKAKLSAWAAISSLRAGIGTAKDLELIEDFLVVWFQSDRAEGLYRLEITQAELEAWRRAINSSNN